MPRLNEQVLIALGYNPNNIEVLYEFFTEHEIVDVIDCISVRTLTSLIKKIASLYIYLKENKKELLKNVFYISEIQNEEIVDFLINEVLKGKDVSNVAKEILKHNIISIDKIKVLCRLNEKEEIDISKLAFLPLNQIILNYTYNIRFVLSVINHEKRNLRL